MRWTHFLDAEVTLAEGYRYGTLVAVCGDLVSESSCAVDGADDNPRYCAACVRSAGVPPRAYADHLAATVELRNAVRRTLREVPLLPSASERSPPSSRRRRGRR